MEFLLDPNIAYFLLIAAILFVLFAIATPGTGVPELIAIFSLALAGYAVYRLSLNWWALVLLVLSLVPFFFAVRGPRRELWLAVSIAGFTLGSVFFFPSAKGLISVNPALAAVTSALFAAFVWLSARKVLQISLVTPVNELSALIGQRGETKTAVKEDGSVQVASELWSARSEKLIPAGSVVRVIGRKGFVLIVEEGSS
jgi:membrane-bound serine protease (ClpP class)